MTGDPCEVSWKCEAHPNRLLTCHRHAEYLAKGVGNEGDSAFRVCAIHADVVRPMTDLWSVRLLSSPAPAPAAQLAEAAAQSASAPASPGPSAGIPSAPASGECPR